MLNHTTLPHLSWQHAADGTLKVKSSVKPREVRLWQATNRAARDFRLESIGPVWSSSPILERDGSFSAKVPKPDEGWTAYMVELTFDTGAKTPLKLTTNITVTPNVLPFPPLKPLQPVGFLSK